MRSWQTASSVESRARLQLLMPWDRVPSVAAGLKLHHPSFSSMSLGDLGENFGKYAISMVMLSVSLA